MLNTLQLVGQMCTAHLDKLRKVGRSDSIQGLKKKQNTSFLCMLLKVKLKINKIKIEQTSTEYFGMLSNALR